MAAFDLHEGTKVLQRTPAVLRTLLPGLPPLFLEGREGDGTWSPVEVVGHLVHGEETDWIPRARLILEAGEDRPFEPFDRVAMLSRFAGTPLAELLDLFESRRGENILTLAAFELRPADLERRGHHPALGSVTLGQLLATWVAHDLSHLAQIVRVMAKQYGDAVGPWKAYLSVFAR